MKNYIALLSSFFLASQSAVFASGKQAPEQGAIGDVIHGMQLFEALHSKQAPTNWMQISETLNLDSINQSLKANGFLPLQQNYVFIQQTIRVPDYEKGEVVLMRVLPITVRIGETNEEEGRYVISRYQGGLKFNWLSEDKVQKMLAEAGVTNLPKPEPLTAATNASETLPVRDLIQITTNITQTIPSTEAVASESATTLQMAQPEKPAVVRATTSAQADPLSESPLFLRPILITLAVILGLAAGFVLLRSRKQG